MDTHARAGRGMLRLSRSKGYTAGLLALVMASAVFAGGASAQTQAKSAPNAAQQTNLVQSSEPNITLVGDHTPRPIKLRPWVQFGHARPGDTADYHKLLMNHLDTSEQVNVEARSAQGWDTGISPANPQITLPGYANVITVSVAVPNNPVHRVDIEQVRAVLSDTTPYTTTAYLITITHRFPWTDLAENNWADDSVQYLYDQGIISGYADGSFHPGDDVTRAQFAKMLVGAMGWSLVSPAAPTFSDVPAGYWAYSYIETAAAHGVISGYSDGTFRPGVDLTRAQVAKTITVARGWTLDSPVLANFTDVSSSDWSYNYVEAMSSAEVMSGYTDNSFRPNAPATRAEIAKILTYSLYSDPNW